MKKLFYLLILLLDCSCNSHHYVKSDFAGIYTGFCHNKKSVTGYNYRLDLNEDGTFMFNQYFDIYRVIGTGKWIKQDKSIILKYDNSPTDISSAITGGSYMKGMDTIQICNTNKLLLKKVKLRKDKHDRW